MIRIISLIVISFGLIACSGAGKVPVAALTAEEEALYGEKTPKEVLAEASEEMKKAYAEDFKNFAPGTLERMEDAVKQIQNGLKDDKLTIAYFVAQLKIIQKGLEDGVIVKGNVKRQLADVYEFRSVLDGLDASTLFPGDYEDIQDEIMDLVELVEEKKFDKARKDAVDLMEEMTDLEVKIFKQRLLTKPENLLDQADDLDAGEHVAKALEEAEKAFELAESMIEKNVRDRDEVNRLGAAALFQASRVVWMTKEVVRLKGLSPAEMESVVTDAETRMKRIADGLGHVDVRDLPLAEQSEVLAKAAEELVKRNRLLMENTQQQSVSPAAEAVMDDVAQPQENEQPAPEFNDENLEEKQAELQATEEGKAQ